MDNHKALDLKDTGCAVVIARTVLAKIMLAKPIGSLGWTKILFSRLPPTRDAMPESNCQTIYITLEKYN
jgi:hypothetical protein